MAIPVKPLDLPMEVVKAFVKDMRAFHAGPNAIKRDEIAARQLPRAPIIPGPRNKKLRLADVTQMFEEMDHFELARADAKRFDINARYLRSRVPISWPPSEPPAWLGPFS